MTWKMKHLVLYLSLFLLFFLGCSNKKEKIQVALEEGDKLMEEGFALDALVKYGKAVKLDKDNYSAREKMAEALFEIRSLDKVVSEVTSILFWGFG